MSVSDIVDYVNRTPHNTNPAVIRSMVENEIYKTKEESNEELKTLKEKGGVGWEEQIVTEIMPATAIPLGFDDGGGSAYYYFYAPRYITSDKVSIYMYINDSKYSAYYDGYGTWSTYQSGEISGAYLSWGVTDPDGNYSDAIIWNTYADGPAPESITVRFEKVEDITHPISEEYMPQSYQGLPSTVEMLSTGGITVVQKAEYEFDVDDDYDVGDVSLNPTQNFDPRLLAFGKTVIVHLDGEDYERAIKPVEAYGINAVVGNPALYDDSLEDTGEPFVIFINDYGELICVARGTDKKRVVGVILNGTTMKSNKIDLNAFQIPEHIMELSANGGGQVTIPGFGFWDTLEASAGTDTRFKMSVAGYTFDIGGLTLAYNDDYSTVGIGQVSFNFLLNNPVTNEIGIIYVSLMRNTPDIVLTVRIVQ